MTGPGNEERDQQEVVVDQDSEKERTTRTAMRRYPTKRVRRGTTMRQCLRVMQILIQRMKLLLLS